MNWILFGENVIIKKRKPIEQFNLAMIDSSLESNESGSLISFISDSQDDSLNSCVSCNMSVKQLDELEFAHFDEVDHALKKTTQTKSCCVLNNNCADGMKTKNHQFGLKKVTQRNHVTCKEKDENLRGFQSLRNVFSDNTFLQPSMKKKKSSVFFKNLSVSSLNELLNERNKLLNNTLLDELTEKLEEFNKVTPRCENSFSSSFKDKTNKINNLNGETSSFCFPSSTCSDTSLDFSNDEIISSRLKLKGSRQEWIKFNEQDNNSINHISFENTGIKCTFQSENFETDKLYNLTNDHKYTICTTMKQGGGEENDFLSNKNNIEKILLDNESEEEINKLSKASITIHPKISLFRSSSVVKQKLSENTEEAFSFTEQSDSEQSNLKQKYASWNFWYRYPGRARRLGRRKWIPVTVFIENGFIKLHGTTKKGSEIFKEFPLHPFFVFTIPKVQRGNKDGQVHSVKLQYVKYKESRRLKNGSNVEHVPVYTPVLKLASRDLLSFREFLNEVERIIRHIPTFRSNMVSYRQEGIFVDCDDECNYLFSGDGKVLQYSITVQLRLRTFISGNPYITIFLNDMNYKDELIAKSLLEDLKPPETWIKPLKYEYHPCVDTKNTNGGVKFLPPDGCSFELLRFRVRAKSLPPLSTMASVEIINNNVVRLKASLCVFGGKNSVHYVREDVLLYIPIPGSWSTMFVRSKSLRGFNKYLKVKATYKTGDAALATLNQVSLQVSVGRATYEPAFGGLVWRLGSLPVIKGNNSGEALHTFQCQFELPFPIIMIEDFQPYAYVEFNVGHQVASDVIVHQVVVSDNKSPEKWICYRSNYMYKIKMKLL
ncbi:stonin-1 [Hydra vulgaris]|uniref:Stonin-1 n=1 Tax=Hydra vulgaris TaxID=6087 RepID=A0ABM4C1I2_HYDVU